MMTIMIVMRSVINIQPVYVMMLGVTACDSLLRFRAALRHRHPRESLHGNHA